MADETSDDRGDPSDFIGKETEKSETSDEEYSQTTSSGTEGSDTATSQEDLGTVNRMLTGAEQTIESVRDRLSSGSDAPGGNGNGGDGDNYDDRDDGEDDSMYRRGLLQGIAGTAAVGAVGVGISDALEGRMFDGKYLTPHIEFDGEEAVPPNATDTPQGTSTPDEGTPEQTTSPSDDSTATPDEGTPEQTTSEQQYEGEIDGRGYELVEVPGAEVIDGMPNNAAGYRVDQSLLSDYDNNGWSDIASDTSEGPNDYGFNNLTASTEWYLTQNSVVGVDENAETDETLVVHFPSRLFDYDTQGLYEEIREDAA